MPPRLRSCFDVGESLRTRVTQLQQVYTWDTDEVPISVSVWWRRSALTMLHPSHVVGSDAWTSDERARSVLRSVDHVQTQHHVRSVDLVPGDSLCCALRVCYDAATQSTWVDSDGHEVGPKSGHIHDGAAPRGEFILMLSPALSGPIFGTVGSAGWCDAASFISAVTLSSGEGEFSFEDAGERPAWLARHARVDAVRASLLQAAGALKRRVVDGALAALGELGAGDFRAEVDLLHQLVPDLARTSLRGVSGPADLRARLLTHDFDVVQGVAARIEGMSMAPGSQSEGSDWDAYDDT